MTYPVPIDSKTSVPIGINLYTIDGIILAHMINKIKPYVSDGEQQILVPIEFANPERWKQMRADGYLRDRNGKIQLPLMMIRRSAVAKSQISSPVNRYLDRSYITGWNKHSSYDKFSVLNGINPSRELVTVKIPDYVDLTYEFIMWTGFIEQMNSLIEQMNFEMDEYWGDRGGFKFLVTVDNYNTDTDVPADEDRVIRTTFTSKVRAYLLPDTMIDTDRGAVSTTSKYYTPKKVISIVEYDNTTGGKEVL